MKTFLINNCDRCPFRFGSEGNYLCDFYHRTITKEWKQLDITKRPYFCKVNKIEVSECAD